MFYRRLAILFWLSYPDSNQEMRHQKPLCYHYTIGQSLSTSSSIPPQIAPQNYKKNHYPQAFRVKYFFKTIIFLQKT